MTELRNLLGDVAEKAKTYDVLDTALRRGRRRRVVRPFVTATATLVAVLAAGAGTVALLHRQRPVEPAAIGPTTVYYNDGTTVLYRFGGDAPTTPVGLVLNHVLSELSAAGAPWHDQSWDEIRQADLKITTTIDARAQAALERAADPAVAGSPMSGQPGNLQAAGVLIEPGTGRVLAYYGGHDPTGADYAGIYHNQTGDLVGFGAHPAGGTFMVYTLAAALRAGYSLNSRWQWTPHAQPGRTADHPVLDTSQCVSDLVGDTPETGNCPLSESVQNTLNVALYDVTASLGVDKVLAMARDAGIQAIWNDQHARLDLGPRDAVSHAVEDGIGLEVGIGQYPVTVLDQANAMATFAAGGIAAGAHFVRMVSHGDHLVYGETLPSPDATPVLTAAQLADLTYTLSHNTQGGSAFATKTGAWESTKSPGLTAHAWDVGYSSALAGAVWLGNAGDEQPLVDKDGSPIRGSMLPQDILMTALEQAQGRLGLTPVPFGPPAHTGDEHPPGSR